MNEIVKYAWNVFQNNIRYIILLSAPFLMVMLGSSFLLELSYDLNIDTTGGAPATGNENSPSLQIENVNPFMMGVGLLSNLIGVSAYISALVFFMSQEYQNQLLPVKANIINGLVYSPLVMVTIVITFLPLIVAIGLMFTTESLLILALPMSFFCMYVFIKTVFTPFHLILEGCRPWEAIVRSFGSTRGKIAKIVRIWLMYFFGVMVVHTMTPAIGSDVFFNSVMLLLGTAMATLLSALRQIAFFKLYLDSFGNDIEGV